ncbi:MAG: PilZ domain-containing protein [Alphaproteobacteria bacterium]
MSNSPVHSGPDQRRFRRIQLSVPVKFLESGEEREGTLLDISAGGLALSSEARPDLGAPIVLYVDNLGRVEGKVVRHIEQGFAVEFAASNAKRERLADRLVWISNRNGQPEDAPRPIALAHRDKPRFIMHDGREVECKVLDMSVNGVWLQVNVKPPLGEEVTIGRMRGRISQHHATGIAIEFVASAFH